MARDAAELANAAVDFKPYDNDRDGFVDARRHPRRRGAEVTGKASDIWSHKWVLAGGAFQADGTKIYAYLTVPEDSKIGVCCHELGHLLFGFPDLYDADYSSAGVGDWCLMAGGSWGGGGDVPCHPSAWCKAAQGWAKVVNVTRNRSVKLEDVKTGNKIYRLWKDGSRGDEYFLVENRQQTNYDRSLTGDGLLVWNIDDAIATNENERRYRVALVQADARRDLELGNNGGDGGPFPGAAGKVAVDGSTTPSTRS
jgi:immune inhibitor A